MASMTSILLGSMTLTSVSLQTNVVMRTFVNGVRSFTQFGPNFLTRYITVHSVERNDGIRETPRVNLHQPQSGLRGREPMESKEFGVLDTSVENEVASVDIRLRFQVHNQIAAVLNQDETIWH